jgi:hypothetical protein
MLAVTVFPIFVGSHIVENAHIVETTASC